MSADLLNGQSDPIDWKAFCQLIHDHQRFMLVSHIRPDCDALGSELGMAGVLESLGKDVKIVNGQGTPESLGFIDPGRRLMAIGEDVAAADLVDREVVLVLDTSAWVQLGPMREVMEGELSHAKRAVLDHHQGEDELGAAMFKNVNAEATGRLVLQAAMHLGVELTSQIAAPLFAALATDTGWFRFPSAGPIAYRAAAALIDAGASPPALYSDLYEHDTLARLKLRGVALSRTAAELDGALVHTYVLREDFEQTGAQPNDTEDVVNLTLRIGGTQAALIMVEQPQGGFKVSFRSRCAMDCSVVASQFGGGGHKAAAGAFVEGELETARPKVLEAVMAAMSSMS